MAVAVVLVVIGTAVALRMNRPLAITEDPVAAAKFAEGLRLQVDMDIDGMNAALGAAVERDPGLAGAHVRIAAWAFEDEPLSARPHLAAAAAHRGRLDEHDRALLDALADRSAGVDVDRIIATTRAAFERFGSPELRAQAAAALHRAARHEEARVLAEGGDVERFLPLAFVAGVSALAESGQEARGVAHLTHCVGRSPSATRCLLALGQARAAVGDVAAARGAFQQLLDRGGDAGRSVTADAARAGLAALSAP